jgi:hypothetical protein
VLKISSVTQKIENKEGTKFYGRGHIEKSKVEEFPCYNSGCGGGGGQ